MEKKIELVNWIVVKIQHIINQRTKAGEAHLGAGNLDD